MLASSPRLKEKTLTIKRKINKSLQKFELLKKRFLAIFRKRAIFDRNFLEKFKYKHIFF